jgi:hypothetical protein
MSKKLIVSKKVQKLVLDRIKSVKKSDFVPLKVFEKMIRQELNYKRINSKSDYKKVMQRIDAIILKKPKKGTELYKELDLLGTLAAAYEEMHIKI